MSVYDDNNIDEPWYTGDFNITYSEIFDGCSVLLNYIIDKKQIQAKLI